MSENSKLGIYISNDSVHFVENIGNQQLVCHSLLNPMINPANETGLMPALANKVAEDIPAKILELLKNSKVTALAAYLSLPPKDIIFRAFTIPWMQPNEVVNAVKFEANKYIPFNLNDLCYAIHPITIKKKESRLQKIIFVAIKKSTLEFYKDTFQKAGLKIEIMEPSTQSFLRILSSKKHLPSNGITAVIEHDDKEGNIIIVEDEIPQFVRTFQLTQSLGQEATLEQTSYITRLINETTISLEYYNRQNPDQEIQNILYISNHKNDAPTKLHEALGIEIKNLVLNELTPNNAINNVECVNAYGSTIYKEIKTVTEFYLDNVEDNKPAVKKTSTRRENIDLKAILPVLFFCAGLVAAVFFITAMQPAKLKKEISQLEQKLGKYAQMDSETIDLKSMTMEKRLKDYQSIRLEGNSFTFLDVIPKLAAQGMWFESIDIKYASTPLPAKNTKNKRISNKADEPDKEVIITGYVYVEEIKDQFNLINEYSQKLKSNKTFSDFFTSIELDTINTKIIDGFKTTQFKITCR